MIKAAAALTGGERKPPPAPTAEVDAAAGTARRDDARPLIAHVIYRLDVGGLENGLVNLINRTPQYRHAIICMTGYTEFHRRIEHDAVTLHALAKREGHDLGVFVRLWRLLRALKPRVVHTRNMAALEAQLPALLAGVRGRVHGEHGRDVHDLDGSNRKYRFLRRAFRPLVRHYIPLSRDLENYLREDVGVPSAKLTQIYNGVDAERFHPAHGGRAPVPLAGFVPRQALVIGAVGRLQTVKDQLNLVRAFVLLLQARPEMTASLRLLIIGDGPLRREAQSLLEKAGAASLAWLPGARDDIPELMRAMDVFVLPSLAEGISNTILEAMATGLPVIATDVGGNGELVVDGETGFLVPAARPQDLADAIARYVNDAELRRRHGHGGRERVEREFSMEAMVARYVAIYEAQLQRA